jgi:hypothetical protein
MLFLFNCSVGLHHFDVYKHRRHQKVISGLSYKCNYKMNLHNIMRIYIYIYIYPNKEITLIDETTEYIKHT